MSAPWKLNPSPTGSIENDGESEISMVNLTQMLSSGDSSPNGILNAGSYGSPSDESRDVAASTPSQNAEQGINPRELKEILIEVQKERAIEKPHQPIKNQIDEEDGTIFGKMRKAFGIGKKKPEQSSDSMRNDRPPHSPRTQQYVNALVNPIENDPGFDFDSESSGMSGNNAGFLSPPVTTPPPGSPPPYSQKDESIQFRPVYGQEPKEKVVDKVLRTLADESAPPRKGDSPPPKDDFYDVVQYPDLTPELRDFLSCTQQYTPVTADLKPELQPFEVEYMPAYGGVDPFIKVPRPDEIDDNVGLISVDEPPCDQSEAAIVDMQIREASKDAAVLNDAVPVKILYNASEKPEEIQQWIAAVQKHRRNIPPSNFRHAPDMPSTETLMQAWDPKLEKKMDINSLLTLPEDISLLELVKIVLNLVDIPVNGRLIPGLTALFTTVHNFKKSQHFRRWEKGVKLPDENGEVNHLVL